MSSHRTGLVILLLGLALVVATAVAVLVKGHVLPVASGKGEAYQYRVNLNADSNGYFVLVSPDPRYEEDFTRYKAASDARVAAWAATPASGPAMDAALVDVTFRKALSPAEVAAVLGDAFEPPVTSIVVGRSASGRPASDYVDGAVTPDMLNVPVRGAACEAEPESCDPVIYRGVIQVSVRPRDGRAGLAALVALVAHPDVYLADSTGLEVVARLGSERPELASQVQQIFLPKPIWTTSGEVQLP